MTSLKVEFHPLALVAFLLLLGARLIGLDVSWWFVTAPLWIPFGLICAAYVVILIGGVVGVAAMSVAAPFKRAWRRRGLSAAKKGATP